MDLNQSIERRYGIPCETGKTVEPNETLHSILTRRSVRSFSNQPVDADLMNTLLAAAFSAPSKSDLQQARVIRVTDQGLKQAIADLSPEVQGWVAKAPEFLVWCGDNSLSHLLAEEHELPYANNHLDQFMNPAVDAGIAMSFFMAAAESTGLGCCPVSSIRDTPFEIAELLKLPQHVFPVAGLVVGYPQEQDLTTTSMRLPPRITVMENEYTADTAAIVAGVRQYDARREAAAPTASEEQRDTETFGIADSYGWSLDKTRQYSKPARTDWGDFIKAQGFQLE